MILVTGGAGFIGSHTVRALSEAGEECVLLQRRTPQTPSHLADLGVQMAQGDIADLESLRRVGRQYPITGIVHLAITLPWSDPSTDPVDRIARGIDGVINILRVGAEWGVARVTVASTIGVYGAATGALTEDQPLPLQHVNAIPTLKKITELIAAQVDAESDLSVITARISGTWGPGGHLPDPFFPAPSLAYAAAHRIAPDLSGLVRRPHADDSLDLCYVKDTGRALALLQLSPGLQQQTYNVGSGRPTSNAEVIAALAAVVPGFEFDLPAGGPEPRWLDTTRLVADTGFAPHYDLTAAAADYVDWLRANER